MAVVTWSKKFKGTVQTNKGSITLTIHKPKGMLSYKLAMGSGTTLKSLACPDDLKDWAKEYFENM